MECDLICEKYETEIKKNLVKQENLKKEETLNYIFEDYFDWKIREISLYIEMNGNTMKL